MAAITHHRFPVLEKQVDRLHDLRFPVLEKQIDRLHDLRFPRHRSHSPTPRRKSGSVPPPRSQRIVPVVIHQGDILTNAGAKNRASSLTRPDISDRRARTDSDLVQSPPFQGLVRPHHRKTCSQRQESVLSKKHELVDYEGVVSAPVKGEKPRYIFRHGRWYLQDSEYFMPSDLQETQRQQLSNLLTSAVLGGPVFSTIDLNNPPKKVLELGCGSGHWSLMCHEYFRDHLKITPPAFVGIDIARAPPDLKQFGVDWTFIQHDITEWLPFPDESFDIIISKDCLLVHSMPEFNRFYGETIRTLKPGGTLEWVMIDLSIRRVVRDEHLQASPGKEKEHQAARELGCQYLRNDARFAPSQISEINDANTYVSNLLSAKHILVNPLRALIYREGFPFIPAENTELRRVAIPFSSSWTWDVDSGEGPTEEQKALRSIALEVVLGWIDAIQPFLQESSGKSEEEWTRWRNELAVSLMDGCAAGESLEIGAWVGRKQLKPFGE
ncbi:S-adenosyl-L-methionine-dependent methyltransferase [Microthyrium microscopicum]|uniref:S-adenosyl-L-methionine-dependent methyltransferase n=1 Tax=Microthyrium microscopicum TaxID=703497 RepID=A0A6A6U6M6_9PEZI|nr:S-adenosyl-L-methionine-dependent methyltransferase [Microthyrium microscopicum]